jgi:hypothetical protein
MKVRLDREIALAAGADVAWELLQDVEAVAACMPGASITQRVDASHYRGTVAVRFGPAAMSFRGDLEVRDVDAAQRTLRLVGKGTDSTGTSGASMELTARIESADQGASRLVGASEVSMSGKAAAFGARMMSGVAEQVLQQFATNFAASAAARGAAPPGAGRAADGSLGAESVAGTPGEVPRARELNGFSLLWAAIKSWLRSLLGKSPA